MDDETLPLVDRICEEILRKPPGGPWLNEELWETALEGPCHGDTELTAEVISYARIQRDAPEGASSFSLRLPPAPPNQIGEFTILEQIAEGGMGTVYKVECQGERFRGLRALKLIKTPPDGVDPQAFLQRFWKEEQCLAELQHPNIINIITDGTHDGKPYFVMPFIDGSHIDKYCASEVTLKQRVALFEQICRAVHYAHNNGTIHCDLKPSNILVSKTGDVTILDFGLATSADRTGESLLKGGSVLFMAPELLDGEDPTVRSDIYSLGMVFDCVLSNCEEFVDPKGKRDRVLALRAAIDKAKNYGPNGRHASVKELGESIERLFSFLPLPRTLKLLPLHRGLKLGGVFTIAAALVVLAFNLDFRKNNPAPLPQSSEVHAKSDPGATTKGSGPQTQTGAAATVPLQKAQPTEQTVLATPSRLQRWNLFPETDRPKNSSSASPLQQSKVVPTEPGEGTFARLAERFSGVITLLGTYPPFQIVSYDRAHRLVVDRFVRHNAFGDQKSFDSVYMLDDVSGHILDSVTDQIFVPQSTGNQQIFTSNSLNYVLDDCTFLHFDDASRRFEKLAPPTSCAAERMFYLAITDQGKIIGTHNASHFGVNLSTYRSSGVCFVGRYVVIYAIGDAECKNKQDMHPSGKDLYNNLTEQYLLLSDLTVHTFPQTIKLGDDTFSDYQAVTVSKDGKLFLGERGGRTFVAETASGNIVKGPQ